MKKVVETRREGGKRGPTLPCLRLCRLLKMYQQGDAGLLIIEVMHDFYGVVCVDCGGTVMIDRSQKLDRDMIVQIILNSIYDGDKSYMDIALSCADDIISCVSAGGRNEVPDR